MPTLRQIERLNRFLLDLYVMKIAPQNINFSHRENKSFIIITIEPIHEIKRTRWFSLDWEGNLKDEEENEIF